ncbi:MAG: hypothetical protein AB7U73_08620 [Pirellulales bacterium]
MRMRLLAPALLALCGLLGTGAQAQESGRRPLIYGGDMSMGELTPTPEMWFYQQELRQFQDPHAMVRRRAEFKAAQRHARMESSAWYGIYNSRPTTQYTPFMGGTYGPAFGGSRDFNRWYPNNRPVILLRGNASGSNYGLW